MVVKKVSIVVSGSWLSASLISTSRRSCPVSRKAGMTPRMRRARKAWISSRPLPFFPRRPSRARVMAAPRPGPVFQEYWTSMCRLFWCSSRCSMHGRDSGGRARRRVRGVHVGLVAGDEPAAQGHQVPEQVGGLAHRGVAAGEFEVEPAQRVGDVGFRGVALRQTGEPAAVGSQGVAEAVDDVGDVQHQSPAVGGEREVRQLPESDDRIGVGQGERQVTAQVPAVQPTTGTDAVEVEVRDTLGQRHALPRLLGRCPQVGADAVHEAVQAGLHGRIAVGEGDHVAHEQLAPAGGEDVLVDEDLPVR
ncbi:hypothetical protein [Streptomyces sp. NPDC052042]|uniref:hypothetical protein n=1 Tax=Streptomyces sp. NPDC052042 TaxID=3365683 RepID=UPI0037D908D0